MKILFVYQYCLLGGVTTQLVNRLEGLKDKWEVHFLFLGDYGGSVAFNQYPHVYILNSREAFGKIIHKHQFEVISIIDTNLVYDWLKTIGYKGFVINEVHTTTQNLNKVQQLKDEKLIDLMLTPSQYMKHTLEEKFGFKHVKPVEIIPNCIEVSKFQVSEEMKSNESPTILWVGKLDDHKRWYDFLEIASILEHQYQSKNFQYVMVGGITASQQVIDQLMQKLLLKKLMHKVKWLSVVNYDDMFMIYQHVYETRGVYVSTTINESFGMTVLEAMCMKLPVVVPKVGALEELVGGYGSNTLYEPQKLEEACQKIINQLGKRYDYQVQAYHPKTVGEQLIEVVNRYRNTK